MEGRDENMEELERRVGECSAFAIRRSFPIRRDTREHFLFKYRRNDTSYSILFSRLLRWLTDRALCQLKAIRRLSRVGWGEVLRFSAPKNATFFPWFFDMPLMGIYDHLLAENFHKASRILLLKHSLICLRPHGHSVLSVQFCCRSKCDAIFL